MPSPFPGIDPYVESQGLWPDLHAEFIVMLRRAINRQLPASYVARIDERMSVVEMANEVKKVHPDVAVARHSLAHGPAASSQAALTLEPVTIPLKLLEEYREAYIEILHQPDHKVVAVVELLSPGNKAGSTRGDFLAKRNAVIKSDAHLIELDFLLGGRRLPMERPLPRGDYFALVARAERRPDCGVFAWAIRDPVPTIPIPLLPPDPDVLVDLGPLFASVYDEARYDVSIQYRAPLTLPLAPEDRAWAEDLGRASVR